MGKTVLETPQNLFDSLNREFGFTLDVCALSYNAKCESFYTPSDDGLQQEWTGVCWCNPPFDKTMGRWVEKAYRASQKGHTAVVLVHGNYHDTAWWHQYVMRSSEIRYVRGRPSFHDAEYKVSLRTIIVVFRPFCDGPPVGVSVDKEGNRITLPPSSGFAHQLKLAEPSSAVA